uniref:Uncharacterized protein n=1 Tax=Anguilla anguilla TaxID=7936 RepID=A0A0E9XQB5_ANGAN
MGVFTILQAKYILTLCNVIYCKIINVIHFVLCYNDIMMNYECKWSPFLSRSYKVSLYNGNCVGLFRLKRSVILTDNGTSFLLNASIHHFFKRPEI